MDHNVIHYIGYYDVNENEKELRGYSLAARNKMDYICNALNKNGYKVLIVSPSKTKNNRFYRGKKIRVNEQTDLKLFPTFPWGNKIQKGFSLLAGEIMLVWYLLTKIKKGQTLLVYHSLGLMNTVRIVKRLKGFKMILEVEEIYQDVVPCSTYTKKNEYKMIRTADKYIFPTELLNEKVNQINKPHTIIYGTYQVEEDRKSRFNDRKIHIVYAGTFDPRKGGAVVAINAGEYLSENYHIHIIGFGTEKQTNNIQKVIEEVSKKSFATITYDGLLKGEEYIQLLQKCDIGLSTQTPGAAFNDTSYPSKILSYMANGLRVVSVRIKAIEKSSIGNTVYYYDEQTPKAIAKTIMSINLKENYNSKEIIKKLDRDFVNNLKDLLESNNV